MTLEPFPVGLVLLVFCLQTIEVLFAVPPMVNLAIRRVWGEGQIGFEKV